MVLTEKVVIAVMRKAHAREIWLIIARIPRE